ncbi:MAG: hypothetical protein K0S80_3312 [Neobacillus sp.]|nr:hypothetical protein [Neobacillus sp.]
MRLFRVAGESLLYLLKLFEGSLLIFLKLILHEDKYCMLFGISVLIETLTLQIWKFNTNPL